MRPVPADPKRRRPWRHRERAHAGRAQNRTRWATVSAMSAAPSASTGRWPRSLSCSMAVCAPAIRTSSSSSPSRASNASNAPPRGDSSRTGCVAAMMERVASMSFASVTALSPRRPGFSFDRTSFDDEHICSYLLPHRFSVIISVPTYVPAAPRFIPRFPPHRSCTGSTRLARRERRGRGLTLDRAAWRHPVLEFTLFRTHCLATSYRIATSAGDDGRCTRLHTRSQATSTAKFDVKWPKSLPRQHLT